MNRKEERLRELKKKKYKLIRIDGDDIEYEDRAGYKYRKNIYNKDEFGENHKYDINNPYCIENINLSLAKKNSGSTIKESTYKGAKNKCTFICGRCGKEFSALLSNVLKYKYCLCSDCVREIQDTKLAEFDAIKKEVSSYGYKLLSKKWIGCHQRIDVADNDGYKGRVKLETLRSGGSFSKFALYNPYSLDNIKLFCKLNGYTCTIPNQKFNGWDKEIKIICECGNVYVVTLEKLINGGQSRCPTCAVKVSKIESDVGRYLDSLGIEYETQKIFNDCRYKRPLPFDFYIQQLNIAIEVQGEQHYFPVKRFGGKKAFDLQIKKDKIKSDYCKYMGIRLLKISYAEIRTGEFQKIIDDFLKCNE